MPKTPTKLEIVRFRRTRKTIYVSYWNGTEHLSIDSRDNPLPALQVSLDALSSIVCKICAFPEGYCAEGMRVLGVTMGEQGEADTVSIFAQKSLSDAAKAFNIITPPRLLAHPSQPGTYTPPLSETDAAAIYDLIENIKDYITGERQQGLLPDLKIDGEEGDDSDDEDQNQTEMPQVNEAAPKKRGRPKKTLPPPPDNVMAMPPAANG